MNEPYLFYRSKHPFSNFYPAHFTVEGLVYPTSEHFYQAAKFWKTNPDWAEEIRRGARTAYEAAQMGRRDDHQVHPDWELGVRDDAMRLALRFKFRQHPELIEALLATDDQMLVEDSPTDYYWGWGKDHTGQNKLGKLLMELRDALRNGQRVLFENIGHPRRSK